MAVRRVASFAFRVPRSFSGVVLVNESPVNTEMLNTKCLPRNAKRHLHQYLALGIVSPGRNTRTTERETLHAERETMRAL